MDMDNFDRLEEIAPRMKSSCIPEKLTNIGKLNIIYDFVDKLVDVNKDSNSNKKTLELKVIISKNLSKEKLLEYSNIKDVEFLYKSLIFISKDQESLENLSNSIYDYFKINRGGKFMFKDIEENLAGVTREEKVNFFKNHLMDSNFLGDAFNEIAKNKKENIENVDDEVMARYSKMDAYTHMMVRDQRLRNSSYSKICEDIIYDAKKAVSNKLNSFVRFVENRTRNTQNTL